MRPNREKLRGVFKKGTAVFLAVILIYDVVGVPLAQASQQPQIWADRRANLPSQPLQEQLPSLRSAFPSELSLGRKIPSNLPASFKNLLGAIPLNTASIKEVSHATGSGTTPVVLVQDIHLNPEAQSNIAAVLSGLIQNGQVDVVGVEGAFSLFDFSQFHSFADKKIVEAISRDFLESNVIGAPSYVGINQPEGTARFVGVDDKSAYKANVAAYLDSQPLVLTVSRSLRQADELLAAKKKKLLSPKLLSLDEARGFYQTGRIGLGSYLKRLSAFSDEPDFNVETFLHACEMESQMDWGRVERERKWVLEKLAGRLNEQETHRLLEASIAYRMGQLSYAAYYTALKKRCLEKNIDLRQAPAFDAYIRYVLLTDGIHADALFAGLKRMEEKVFARLAVTPEEKELVQKSRQLLLAQKLVKFELTPEEWSEYRSYRHDLSSFESFYQHADLRSEKIVANLLKEPSRSARVLVAGGYHTAMLKDFLMKQQVPFVVVAPKVTKVPTDGGSAYLTVFAREKTPIEKLFAGEKLFVSPDKITVGSGPRSHPYKVLMLALIATAIVAAGGVVAESLGIVVVPDLSHSGLFKVTMSKEVLVPLYVGLGSVVVAQAKHAADFKVGRSAVWVRNPFATWIQRTKLVIASFFGQPPDVPAREKPNVAEPTPGPSFWRDTLITGFYVLFLVYMMYVVVPYYASLLSSEGVGYFLLYFTGNVVSVLTIVTVGTRWSVRSLARVRWGRKIIRAAQRGYKGYTRWTHEVGKGSELVTGVLHLPVGLTKTMYGFGFERIDRLVQIMEGKEVAERGWIEKAFTITPKPLRIFLLPIVATISLLGKRLTLKVYSTIGQIVLTGALSGALLAAALAMGYAPETSLSWLSAVMNWNLLDLVMGAGWAHGIAAQGGVPMAAVQLFSVFGIMNSYVLSLLLQFGKYRRLRVPVRLKDGTVGSASIFWLAFKNAYGLEGLHMVGLEIEVLKWMSEPFEHLHTLVMKIEGHEGVLGAGDQFIDRALKPFGLHADELVRFQGKTQREIQEIWFRERAQQSVHDAAALLALAQSRQPEQKEAEPIVTAQKKPEQAVTVQNQPDAPVEQPAEKATPQSTLPPLEKRPALPEEIENILRHGGFLPPGENKTPEDPYKAVFEKGVGVETRAAPPNEAVKDVEKLLAFARLERTKLDADIQDALAREKRGQALADVRALLNSNLHAAAVDADGRIIKENGLELSFKTRDDLREFIALNADRVRFQVSKESIEGLRKDIDLDDEGYLINPMQRMKILDLEQSGKIFDVRIKVKKTATTESFEIITAVRASLENSVATLDDRAVHGRRAALWKALDEKRLNLNQPVVPVEIERAGKPETAGPDVVSERNPFRSAPKQAPVSLGSLFGKLQSAANLSIKTQFNLDPRISLNLINIEKSSGKGNRINSYRDLLRPLWYFLSKEEGGELADLVELDGQGRGDVKLDIDKYKEYESGAAVINPLLLSVEASASAGGPGGGPAEVSFVVNGRAWNLPVSADPDGANHPAPRFLADKSYHTAIDQKTGRPFVLTPRQLRELKANAPRRLIFVDSLNGGRVVEGPQGPDGALLDIYLLPELSEKEQADIFRPEATRVGLRVLKAGGLQIMSSRAAVEWEVLKSKESENRIKNMKTEKIEERLDTKTDLITLNTNGTEFNGPEIHKNEHYFDALRQKRVEVEVEVTPGQWEKLDAQRFLSRHPQDKASEAILQGRYRIWKLDDKRAREKEIYSFEQLLARGNILVFAPDGRRMSLEEARVSHMELNFYLTVDANGKLLDVKSADPNRLFAQVKFVEDITDPLSGRVFQVNLKEIKSDGKIGSALARRESERLFLQKTQEIALRVATQHTVFLLDKPLDESIPLSRIVGGTVRGRDAELALQGVSAAFRSKVRAVNVGDFTYQLGTIKDGFGGRKKGAIVSISWVGENGMTDSMPLVPESQIVSRDETFEGLVGGIEMSDDGSVVKLYRPEEVDSPSDIHQIWDFENVGRVIADQIRRNDQLDVYTHEIGDIHIRVERIPPSPQDPRAKSGYLHYDSKVTYTNIKTGQKDEFIEYNSDNEGWTQLFQIIRRLEAFARITQVQDPKSKLDLAVLNNAGELLPGRWQSPSGYQGSILASVQNGELARRFRTDNWIKQIQNKNPISTFNPFDRSTGLLRLVKEGDRVRAHRFLLGSSESSRPFHESRKALLKNDFRQNPPKVPERRLTIQEFVQELKEASLIEGRLVPPFPGLRTTLEIPKEIQEVFKREGITPSPMWFYMNQMLALDVLRGGRSRIALSKAIPFANMEVDPKYGERTTRNRYQYTWNERESFFETLRGVFADKKPVPMEDPGGLPIKIGYDLPPDPAMRAWRFSTTELVQIFGTYGQGTVDMREGPTKLWTIESGHPNIQRTFLESVEDMHVQAADLLVMIHGGGRGSDITWKKSKHWDEKNQPILYPQIKKQAWVAPVQEKLRTLASNGVYPNAAGVYDLSEKGAEGPHRMVFEFDGGLRLSKARYEKAIVNEQSAQMKAEIREKEKGGVVHVKMAERRISGGTTRAVAGFLANTLAAVRGIWAESRQRSELKVNQQKEIRPVGAMAPFSGEGQKSPVPLSDLTKTLGMVSGYHSKADINLKPRVSLPIFEGPLIKGNRIKPANYYWSSEEGGPADMIEGKNDRMDILAQWENYKEVLSGSFVVDFLRWKQPSITTGAGSEVLHKEDMIRKLEEFLQTAQVSSTMNVRTGLEEAISDLDLSPKNPIFKKKAQEYRRYARESVVRLSVFRDSRYLEKAKNMAWDIKKHLQRADGGVARASSYDVEFLADQGDAYFLLKELARMERELVADEEAAYHSKTHLENAKKNEAAANRILKFVVKDLWDPKKKMFRGGIRWTQDGRGRKFLPDSDSKADQIRLLNQIGIDDLIGFTLPGESEPRIKLDDIIFIANRTEPVTSPEITVRMIIAKLHVSSYLRAKHGQTPKYVKEAQEQEQEAAHLINRLLSLQRGENGGFGDAYDAEGNMKAPGESLRSSAYVHSLLRGFDLSTGRKVHVPWPAGFESSPIVSEKTIKEIQGGIEKLRDEIENLQSDRKAKESRKKVLLAELKEAKENRPNNKDIPEEEKDRLQEIREKLKEELAQSGKDAKFEEYYNAMRKFGVVVFKIRNANGKMQSHSIPLPEDDAKAGIGMEMWGSTRNGYLLYGKYQSRALRSLLGQYRIPDGVEVRFGEKALDYLSESLLKTGTIQQLHPDLHTYRNLILEKELYGVAKVYGERTTYTIDSNVIAHVKPKDGVEGAFTYQAGGKEYQVTLTPKGRTYVERIHRLERELQTLADLDGPQSFNARLNQMNQLLADKEKRLAEGRKKLSELKKAEREKKIPAPSERLAFSETSLTDQLRKKLSETGVEMHLEERLRDWVEEGRVEIEYEDAPGTWVKLDGKIFLNRNPYHRANSALAEGRYRIWMRDNKGSRGKEIFCVEQLLARGDLHNLPGADKSQIKNILYEGEMGTRLLARQIDREVQNRNQTIATEIMGRHALFLAPEPFNPDLPLTQIVGDAMREQDIAGQKKKMPENLQESVRIVRTNTIRYEIGTVRDEKGRERKGRVIRFSYVDSQNKPGSIDVVPKENVVKVDETYRGKVGLAEVGDDGGILKIRRPDEVRPPDDAKALRDFAESWENLLLQINENPRLPMYFYKGSLEGVSVTIKAVAPADSERKKPLYHRDWMITLHSNRTGRDDIFIEPYGDPNDELESTLRTLRRYVAYARVTQEKDPRTAMGVLAVTQDGRILPSPWTTPTELPLDLQAAVARGDLNKNYKAEDWTTLTRIQSPLSVISAADRVVGFVRFDMDSAGKPHLRRIIYGAEEATRPFRENRREMFTSDLRRSHPDNPGEDEPLIKLMNLRYGFPLEGGLSRPLPPVPPQKNARRIPTFLGQTLDIVLRKGREHLPEISNRSSAQSALFDTLSRLSGLPNFYALTEQSAKLQQHIEQGEVQLRVQQQSQIDRARKPSGSVPTSRLRYLLRSWERVIGLEIAHKELEEAADAQARLVKPFPGFHGEFSLPASLSDTLEAFGLPADPILLYSNPALAYQYVHHSPKSRWPKAILDSSQVFPLSQLEESQSFLPAVGSYKSDPPVLVRHPLGGPAQIGYEPQPNEAMRAWLAMRGEMTFFRGTYGRNEVDATGGSPTLGWNIEWGLPGATRRLLQSMEDMNAEAVDFMALIQGGFSGWNQTMKPSGMKDKSGKEIFAPELKRLSSAGAAVEQMSALKKMGVGVRADGFMDYQETKDGQFLGRVVGHFDQGLRGLGDERQVARERVKEAQKKARQAGAEEPVVEKTFDKKPAPSKSLLDWVQKRLADYAAKPVGMREPAQPESLERLVGADGRKQFKKVFDAALEGAEQNRFDSMRNLHVWKKGNDRYSWDGQTLQRLNPAGRPVESWERVYGADDAQEELARWQAMLDIMPQRVELMEKGGYTLLDGASGKFIETQMGQSAFQNAKKGMFEVKGKSRQIEALQFLSYKGPDPSGQRAGEFLILIIPTKEEAEKSARQNALDPSRLPDIPALKDLREIVAKVFRELPGTPNQVAQAQEQGKLRASRVKDLYEIQQAGEGGGGVVLSPEGFFQRYEKNALTLRDEFDDPERVPNPKPKERRMKVKADGYVSFVRRDGNTVIVMDDPQGTNHYGRTEVEQLQAQGRLLDNRIGLLEQALAALKKNEIVPHADLIAGSIYPPGTIFVDGLPDFDDNDHLTVQSFPLLSKRDADGLPANRRSIKTQVLDLSGFPLIQTSAAGLETQFNLPETKRLSYEAQVPVQVPAAIKWNGKNILVFDNPVEIREEGRLVGVRLVSRATADAPEGVTGQEIEYRIYQVPDTSILALRPTTKINDLGRTLYHYNELGFLEFAEFQVRKQGNWKRMTLSKPRLAQDGYPLADGNGNFIRDIANDFTTETAVERVSAIGELVRRDAGFSTAINADFTDHPVTEEWTPQTTVLFEGGEVRERQATSVQENGDTLHNRFLVILSRALEQGPKLVEQFRSQDTRNAAGNLKSRRQRIIKEWLLQPFQNLLFPVYAETEDIFDTKAEHDLFPEWGIQGLEVQKKAKDENGLLREYSYKVKKDPEDERGLPLLTINIRIADTSEIHDIYRDTVVAFIPGTQGKAAEWARYERLTKKGYTHTFKFVRMTSEGQTDFRLRRISMEDPDGGLTRFVYGISNKNGIAAWGSHAIKDQYSATLLESSDTSEPIVDRETGQPLHAAVQVKADSVGLYRFQVYDRYPGGEIEEGAIRFMNVFGQIERQVEKEDKAPSYFSDFAQDPLTLEWKYQTSLTVRGDNFNLFRHHFNPITWAPKSSLQTNVDEAAQTARKKAMRVSLLGSLISAAIALTFVSLAFGGAVLIPVLWATPLGVALGFLFFAMFGIWPIVAFVLFVSQAIRINGKAPVAFVQGKIMYADLARMMNLPSLLQNSIFSHEGWHVAGWGETMAYIKQALGFPGLLLKPQARRLNLEKQSIVDLVANSQIKLGLNELTEENKAGRPWGDMSERFNKWLDERVDKTNVPQESIERMRSVYAHELHRKLTDNKGLTNRFAGSLGAFYADANATNELKVVLNYLNEGDILQQSLAAFAKSLTQRGGDKIKNVFVVRNEVERTLLKSAPIFAHAIRIGAVKVLVEAEAETLSMVLSQLPDSIFLSQAELKRASFRFLVRAGMDMSHFIGDEKFNPEQVRFFLVITNTLNPAIVEVESQDLDNLDRIFRLGSQNA